MKILVITDKLYPDEYGGSCTVAYELISNWQKNNSVDIFTCYPEKTTNDNLFCGYVNRNFKKSNLVSSAFCLRKMLKKTEYDVVVTHSVMSWFVYYIATFYMCKIHKLFTVFHGPWHKEAKLKYQGLNSYWKLYLVVPMMMCLEKLYCRYNDNYIFLSKYMFDQLCDISSSVVNKHIFFIPGGVDTQQYKRKYSKVEARALVDLPQDKYIIFTLRRLDKRMGLDNAIEALKCMDESERKRFLLVIGGSGDYATVLKRKAQSIIDNVIFTGFIPDEDVNKYFCAADLFVLPSLDLEGFGLVNLEALACGLPVLATPQGGIVELADILDGMYLTVDNSSSAICDEILRLSEKNIVVKDNMEMYDWSKIAQRYIDIFSK